MRTRLIALLAGTALAVFGGAATAAPHIDVGISFGIPAPVYAPPQAVYYPAPRVVYGPPVVYAPPAPVYYGPPRGYVYYGNPGWNRGWGNDYRGDRYGHGNGHGHGRGQPGHWR